MKLDKIITQPFLKTKPLKCSYIAGNYEERILFPIKSNDDLTVIERLAQVGFRRNINYMYLPVCKGCSKCISTRILIDGFTISKSQRRNIKKNKDIKFTTMIPNREKERYDLFRKYLSFRHSDGMMLNMTRGDFDNFFYETPAKSRVYDIISESDKILGSILLDEMTDAMSAVYSFYEPKLLSNGLGILLILKSLEEAKRINKKYLYLGYWVKESKKMNYKILFNNLQLFIDGNWISSGRP